MIVGARSSATMKVKAGGDHYFLEAAAQSDDPGQVRMISVKPCGGTPMRPKDGDEDGDGKADVLGIQAGTGNLYYYRMTGRGLANGIKAGTGWGNMVFMQRVNEIQGPRSRNVLIAIHRNGTVWSYDNLGRGRLSGGRQIGSGLKGYSAFAVTTTNTNMMGANGYGIGAHELLAVRNGWLYSARVSASSVGGMTRHDAVDSDSWGTINEWRTNSRKLLAMRNFDGNGDGDLLDIDSSGNFWFHKYQATMFQSFAAPKRVGTSWNQMGIVASPGSLNGDRLNDVIARRNDGNLYTYTNKGGKWAAGVRIGQRWNAIRLLA
ncbi:hypothetical protein AAEX63_09940 [Luteococcus sp. H138]|uniref:hypothetical protein n=1 Tax=unclassified Luteococcus TaxID=2639923 RepID=UPI00313A999C